MKFPKLTSDDRKKLIDTDELLFAEIFTHNAACRYGHRSGWCTAAPSYDREFNCSIRLHRCFILILKDPDTKMWIQVRKNKKAAIELYGTNRNNQPIVDELVQLLIPQVVWDKLQDIQREITQSKVGNERKPIWKVGDIINNYSGRAIITLSSDRSVHLPICPGSPFNPRTVPAFKLTVPLRCIKTAKVIEIMGPQLAIIQPLEIMSLESLKEAEFLKSIMVRNGLGPIRIRQTRKWQMN